MAAAALTTPHQTGQQLHSAATADIDGVVVREIPTPELATLQMESPGSKDISTEETDALEMELGERSDAGTFEKDSAFEGDIKAKQDAGATVAARCLEDPSTTAEREESRPSVGLLSEEICISNDTASLHTTRCTQMKSAGNSNFDESAAEFTSNDTTNLAGEIGCSNCESQSILEKKDDSGASGAQSYVLLESVHDGERRSAGKNESFANAARPINVPRETEALSTGMQPQQAERQPGEKPSLTSPLQSVLQNRQTALAHESPEMKRVLNLTDRCTSREILASRIELLEKELVDREEQHHAEKRDLEATVEALLSSSRSERERESRIADLLLEHRSSRSKQQRPFTNERKHTHVICVQKGVDSEETDKGDNQQRNGCELLSQQLQQKTLKILPVDSSLSTETRPTPEYLPLVHPRQRTTTGNEAKVHLDNEEKKLCANGGPSHWAPSSNDSSAIDAGVRKEKITPVEISPKGVSTTSPFARGDQKKGSNKVVDHPRQQQQKQQRPPIEEEKKDSARRLKRNGAWWRQQVVNRLRLPGPNLTRKQFLSTFSHAETGVDASLLDAVFDRLKVHHQTNDGAPGEVVTIPHVLDILEKTNGTNILHTLNAAELLEANVRCIERKMMSQKTELQNFAVRLVCRFFLALSKKTFGELETACRRVASREAVRTYAEELDNYRHLLIKSLAAEKNISLDQSTVVVSKCIHNMRTELENDVLLLLHGGPPRLHAEQHIDEAAKHHGQQSLMAMGKHPQSLGNNARLLTTEVSTAAALAAAAAPHIYPGSPRIASVQSIMLPQIYSCNADRCPSALAPSQFSTSETAPATDIHAYSRALMPVASDTGAAAFAQSPHPGAAAASFRYVLPAALSSKATPSAINACGSAVPLAATAAAPPHAVAGAPRAAAAAPLAAGAAAPCAGAAAPFAATAGSSLAASASFPTTVARSPSIAAALRPTRGEVALEKDNEQQKGKKTDYDSVLARDGEKANIAKPAETSAAEAVLRHLPTATVAGNEMDIRKNILQGKKTDATLFQVVGDDVSAASVTASLNTGEDRVLQRTPQAEGELCTVEYRYADGTVVTNPAHLPEGAKVAEAAARAYLEETARMAQEAAKRAEEAVLAHFAAAAVGGGGGGSVPSASFAAAQYQKAFAALNSTSGTKGAGQQYPFPAKIPMQNEKHDAAPGPNIQSVISTTAPVAVREQQQQQHAREQQQQQHAREQQQQQHAREQQQQQHARNQKQQQQQFAQQRGQQLQWDLQHMLAPTVVGGALRPLPTSVVAAAAERREAKQMPCGRVERGGNISATVEETGDSQREGELMEANFPHYANTRHRNNNADAFAPTRRAASSATSANLPDYAAAAAGLVPPGFPPSAAGQLHALLQQQRLLTAAPRMMTHGEVTATAAAADAAVAAAQQSQLAAAGSTPYIISRGRTSRSLTPQGTETEGYNRRSKGGCIVGSPQRRLKRRSNSSRSRTASVNSIQRAAGRFFASLGLWKSEEEAEEEEERNVAGANLPKNDGLAAAAEKYLNSQQQMQQQMQMQMQPQQQEEGVEAQQASLQQHLRQQAQLQQQWHLQQRQLQLLQQQQLQRQQQHLQQQTLTTSPVAVPGKAPSRTTTSCEIPAACFVPAPAMSHGEEAARLYGASVADMQQQYIQKGGGNPYIYYTGRAQEKAGLRAYMGLFPQEQYRSAQQQHEEEQQRHRQKQDHEKEKQQQPRQGRLHQEETKQQQQHALNRPQHQETTQQQQHHEKGRLQGQEKKQQQQQRGSETEGWISTRSFLLKGVPADASADSLQQQHHMSEKDFAAATVTAAAAAAEEKPSTAQVENVLSFEVEDEKKKATATEKSMHVFAPSDKKDVPGKQMETRAGESHKGIQQRYKSNVDLTDKLASQQQQQKQQCFMMQQQQAAGGYNQDTTRDTSIVTTHIPQQGDTPNAVHSIATADAYVVAARALQQTENSHVMPTTTTTSAAFHPAAASPNRQPAGATTPAPLAHASASYFAAAAAGTYSAAAAGEYKFALAGGEEYKSTAVAEEYTHAAAGAAAPASSCVSEQRDQPSTAMPRAAVPSSPMVLAYASPAVSSIYQGRKQKTEISSSTLPAESSAAAAYPPLPIIRKRVTSFAEVPLPQVGGQQVANFTQVQTQLDNLSQRQIEAYARQYGLYTTPQAAAAALGGVPLRGVGAVSGEATFNNYAHFFSQHQASPAIPPSYVFTKSS